MRYSSRYLLLVFLLLCASQPFYAQLDPTFGTGGHMERVLPGTQVPIKPFLLPDGKILVLTNSVFSNNNFSYLLARYNSDGSLDTAYGTNGELTLAIPFLTGCCIARGLSDALIQPDGKLVIVGADGDGLIMRFNADGSVDNTFSTDGIDRPNVNPSGTDVIYAIQYQMDGKLVAIGLSNTGVFLIRYNTDGSLDSTYGNQGVAVHALGSSNTLTVGLQSDGRPLVMPGSSGTDSSRQVYRINLDGSLDATFVSPSLPIGQGNRALLTLSDDKIIVADAPRFIDQFGRPQADLRLRRLNANGGLDTSFGTAGTMTIDVSHSMPDYYIGSILKPDGSFIIATQTNVEHNRTLVDGGKIGLLHFNASGTMIGRSLAAPRNVELFALGSASLLLQPDGKLLIVSFRTIDDPQNQNLYDVIMSRHLGVPYNSYRFRAAPYDVSDTTDYEGPGGGRSYPSVLRSRNLFMGGYSISNFGLASDIDVHSDYIGTFATDLATFRPGNGTWYISRNTYILAQNNFYIIRWGLNGDIPVPYDYDADGKSDVAVFRPSDGNWYVQNFFTGATQIVHWGLNGDKPVVGDYDGDGIGDVAVWRPLTAVWYILRSSDGQAMIAKFGVDGDIPVQEDYDGDGKTDIAIWRPSTGVWYIWRSSDDGYTIMQFGLSGDTPTPADYDGDAKADISVWRSGIWYQYRSTTNAVTQFNYGIAGDIPLLGRY